MSASPYDGLYSDNNMPLGLVKTLQDLLKKNANNPNIPNPWVPSSDRQWLSVPRSPSSYSLRHSVYTFSDAPNYFNPDGSRTSLGAGNLTPDQGLDLDFNQAGYGAQIARLLDPNVFNWYPIAYNSAAFPLSAGVNNAVDKAVSMILSSSSKVFLIGQGIGAVVTGKLYEEFQTGGRLASRNSDLLGVYSFGSPMRQAGHTVPGGTDPGGHGIAPAVDRLTSTSSLVWEFAYQRDPIAVQGDDLSGEIYSLLYNAIYNASSIDTLMDELSSFSSSSDLFGGLPAELPFQLAIDNLDFDLSEAIKILIQELFGNGSGNHDQYQSLFPITGVQHNSIETALISIQSISTTSPPLVVGDNSTEVLTINYRTPVSISEISFEVIKNSVYVEVWFLDRTSVWRQVLDEDSSPITVQVAYSTDLSWYKYHTYTYPIVAKALQLRLTRVPSMTMGSAAYSVGVRNILVRRNVYNRSAGLQGIDDETDAFGNIISKVIKDWDASKAIDDNSNTYWRSFPQPDPSAVVCFYLDTRDSAGNAQLVDKIYLDPVYTGQALNIYYSNDDTSVSQQLNPASIIPVSDYQIANVEFSTVAGTSSKTATLEINVAPSVSVGDNIVVSGVSSELDGTYSVTGASYSSPFSVSYALDSSASTQSRTACIGTVTVIASDNFQWSSGSGLTDTVALDDNTSVSVYRAPFSTGPMVSQDCWVGAQWTPLFDTFNYKLIVSPTGTPPSLTTYYTPGSSSGIVTLGSGATGDGSTATISFGSNPGIAVGDLITIMGMTPTNYNGTYTVTAVSNTSGHTVSFACTETGTQTTAGTVFIGAKLDLTNALATTGLSSPTIGNVYSVHDRSTGDLIYSKIMHTDSHATLSGNILRIPSVLIPRRCASTDTYVVYYQVHGPSPTQLTLFGITPDTSVNNPSWPKMYYDTNNAQIALEFSFQDPAKSPVTYYAPLTTLPESGTTINIVAGWRYHQGANPTVYIAARTNSQFPLTYDPSTGSSFLEFDAPDVPTQVSLSGKIGFSQWRGTFGAHIVKHEAYDSPTTNSTSSEDFLANPSTYCNPDPVLIPTGSTVSPASSLSSAVLAVDWTTQQFASGGSDSSQYSDKEWTPVWVNYVSEKGFLYLPQTTSMKYVKFEFTQLTAESYPIYDQGIQVSYQVFPITITQTQSGTGLVGATTTTSGIDSINWLNPSSISKAVNAVFGTTVQPVQTQIQIGSGYTTNILPSATQSAATASVRTEASSPQVYRRTMMNPTSLAKNFLSTLLGKSDKQGIQSLITPSQAKLVADQTPVSPPTSASPAALPFQGQDWWVFPGQTLRMPANVVTGVTGSQVVTSRSNSLAVRTRFTTIAVHQYETKTVTLDASLGYFAGIREVQPYVVTHIDYEDPSEFSFDNYDTSTDWSPVNINKLDTGPITANSNPYTVKNFGFDADINYWSGTGWNWDTSNGHSLASSWQPGLPLIYGAAHTTANGTLRTLESDPITIVPGDTINFSAWVVYKDLTYTVGTGSQIFVNLIGLDSSGTPVGDPIGLGEYMQITSDGTLDLPEQNVFPSEQPASSVPQVGVLAVPIYGSVDFSTLSGHSGVTQVKICLNVNADITAGDIWFDDITMTPSLGTVGSIQKTITTNAKFCRLKVDFSDSGLVRSDPLWAFLDNSNDPRRTVLARYVSTIPDPSALAGFWSDIKTDWADANVGWGSLYNETAISYSETVYDNKRTIHFYRQQSISSSSAGIVVRQEINFVPNGLFRICATFFKNTVTNNSITFSLWRISGSGTGLSGSAYSADGEVHSETLNNVTTGSWYTYQGAWVPIPDGQDQVYRLQMELTGDDTDDLYLNDLWVDIAQIRYHVQLGPDLHEVTPLVNTDNGTVGTTEGVNQMVIGITINGDNSFAYSSRFTPLYLQ